MEDMMVINALLEEALWQPVKFNRNHDLTIREPRPRMWELQERI